MNSCYKLCAAQWSIKVRLSVDCFIRVTVLLENITAFATQLLAPLHFYIIRLHT